MGWWMKREKKQILKTGEKLLEDLIERCDGKSNPIKYFSADEIRKATNNFSKSNRVSQLYGIEYKWYSGKNKNHDMMLIKKGVHRFNVFRQGYICRDIAVSSMVSGHKNFFKLVGCCLEFNYPVMVYHGVKKHYTLDIKEQPWKGRMKIVEDIATALAYLHTAFPRPFVYRSMGLSDIFLDEDGVGKLSGFSNCVSIPEGETFVQVDTIVGTYGHMDDKYMSSGIVSEETDVFAIGIVMQKLLIGQGRFNGNVLEKEDAKEEGASEGEHGSAINMDTNDSATMSKIYGPKRHFQSRLLKFMEEGRMDKIVDPEMVEKMGEISEQELCQMKAFGMLSMRCVGCRGEVPTMVKVAKELKKIQRSLENNSSSPSGETPFDSAQHISSSILIGTGEVPTMAEESKELKKIQITLENDSSSLSDETPFDSAQNSSSSVVLSNQSLNTKALLTCIAYQVIHEIFQWVMLNWFRFFRKNRRMC